MKHKTWFRLVVKAIGLLSMVLSLPSVATLSVGLLGWALGLTDPMGGNVAFSYNWPYYIGGLLQLGIGLYLFIGGGLIVNFCIPSNRAYCPDCGYDLRESTGGRCAECGATLPSNQPGTAHETSGSSARPGA